MIDWLIPGLKEVKYDSFWLFLICNKQLRINKKVALEETNFGFPLKIRRNVHVCQCVSPSSILFTPVQAIASLGKRQRRSHKLP